MNNAERPLVSVLMTSYNREKYIAEAIESVLASSYSNLELIVCDDCSTDSTVAIARSYAARDPRVRVFVNESNLGDYPNRNQAASHANGVYIKYLDADDVFYYYGLEVMVNAMLTFPQAGFGLSSKVDDRKPFPLCTDPLETYREHFNGFSHFHRAPGSSIIRTDAFREMKGFSGRRMIGDLEFWFKIAMHYPMVKFPFDMYWNRLHEGQESQTEYARKNYARLTQEVCSNALHHPDCPLPEEEKKQALQRMKYPRLRNIIKRFR